MVAKVDSRLVLIGGPVKGDTLQEYIDWLEHKILVLENRLEKLEKDFYVESIVLGNERDREEAIR